jgi:hypothetical protein
MIWSSKVISSIVPASRIFRVSFISASLGKSVPDGWLWALCKALHKWALWKVITYAK